MEEKMRLTPPKKLTFWLAIILGALGVIAKLGLVAVLAPYAFWLVVAGLVLLALGNAVKGF
jgi:4-hydroxybenzoate polyprenyltransferase